MYILKSLYPRLFQSWIETNNLLTFKVTSQEVLVNVSDQVVERISKILSLR